MTDTHLAGTGLSKEVLDVLLVQIAKRGLTQLTDKDFGVVAERGDDCGLDSTILSKSSMATTAFGGDREDGTRPLGPVQRQRPYSSFGRYLVKVSPALPLVRCDA